MAAIVSEESGVGSSFGGVQGGQRGQPVDALAEWRSPEQVENGCPSTSPPYWDTDDDDEGAKPSELYGKHTWKIEKFSQINKRELRGTVFEVGSYKWYILIYPQGCDVCNHLSLFLCVANHDKLLPGWSHFAQFTIAVVNKDPKKSKYSDTLHRFWKKEHDWGWKKFMELSKVLDGFIDADTLIIKAQVQVIREKVDRPFRCLDLQYRRELVRVYLSNVEQICRKFVEEKRAKLMELIEDKARWLSFCSFWLGMDQNVRRRMSREKTDVIFKAVVKQFFIEKEVTSTLVMDSLYSGLKALEGQSECNKGKVKLLEAGEMPAPVVHVENGMFLLVDDVLLLLERAAMEPLPPKDDKGPQNRTKDGASGEECNKDSIERDERRLTEMGRRTVETFVLAHIFSQKIEVAYQEAVALKRQEELIREEEEAGLAESELKAKRRGTEKEKKSKKKQAKQKRNNRRGKDKGSYERAYARIPVQQVQEIANDEMKDLMIEQERRVLGKPELLEDVSDVSDSVDFVAENSQADSEERYSSPVNWDTDTSEVHLPTEASGSGISGVSCEQLVTTEKKSSSVMDDSSSTCSTDSVPSVVMSGPYKGNSFSNHKAQKFPTRGNADRVKATNDSTSLANEADDRPCVPTASTGDLNDVSWSCKNEVVSLQRKLCVRDQDDAEKHSKEKVGAVPLSPRSPPRNSPSHIKMKSDTIPVRKPFYSSAQHADKSAPSTLLQVSIPAKTDTQKAATSKPTDRPTKPQVPVMSRPSSAPLVPDPRPPAPVFPVVQTAPLLARSVSATGRLGPDTSTLTHSSHSYVPQSYRNAMMGNPVTSTSPGPHPRTPSSILKPHSSTPLPVDVHQPSDSADVNMTKISFSLDMGNRDVVQNGGPWRDASGDPSSLMNDIKNFDLYKRVGAGPQEQLSTESPAGTSGRQTQGMLADDFPHLDIINDLLDDEHGIGKAAPVFQSHTNGLDRQYSFPGNVVGRSGDDSPSSSCRFERSLSYQSDGFQGAYGSLGNRLNTTIDYIPQSNLLPYANGQIDGPMPNQWQVSAPDLSLLSMRSADADAYQYHMPEYQNLACSVNGYTVFRPSNGH